MVSGGVNVPPPFYYIGPQLPGCPVVPPPSDTSGHIQPPTKGINPIRVPGYPDCVIYF